MNRGEVRAREEKAVDGSGRDGRPGVGGGMWMVSSVRSERRWDERWGVGEVNGGSGGMREEEREEENGMGEEEVDRGMMNVLRR